VRNVDRRRLRKDRTSRATVNVKSKEEDTTEQKKKRSLVFLPHAQQKGPEMKYL